MNMGKDSFWYQILIVLIPWSPMGNFWNLLKIKAIVEKNSGQKLVGAGKGSGTPNGPRFGYQMVPMGCTNTN